MATSTNPDTQNADIPVVGKREPCPCGSGKRYKVCHGKASRAARTPAPPARSFEGLALEGDLVALRDLVPAANFDITTTAEYGSRTITVCTVLPGACAAQHFNDGQVRIGLQVMTKSDDVTRDVGATITAILDTEPGSTLAAPPLTGDRPRLQDVIDPASSPQIRIFETFDFWQQDPDNPNDQLTHAIEHANQAITPTDKLLSVNSAYWCTLDGVPHLRWILPDDEERVLNALCRLHAARENTLADEDCKYLGAFRTHGLVVPVWQLPAGWTSEDTEDPAAAWYGRYQKALASDAPLTPDERRARGGIVSRQLTLR